MDSNKSPVGWYLASYLLRFIGINDEGNDEIENRFLTWENTIIVQAENLDEAYEKTVKIAMRATEPYKGGESGEDVKWVFEGLSELVPIYEELEDGAEIAWTDLGSRKLKNIKKQAWSKDELVPNSK